MKKKFFSKLISIFLAISMVFSLSGCEFLDEILSQLQGSEHQWEQTWSYNASEHYHACATCEEKSDVSGHTFPEVDGDSECIVCGYVKVQPKGEISFHFMTLGNKYTGDCIYIKAGDNDILIDGGSRTSSYSDIDEYIKDYVGKDRTLEYVIVTHGDQDHIAAFAGDNSNDSLFTLYDCKTIIDFPKTDKDTAVINNYFASRDAEIKAGATHYTALECYNNKNGAQKVYNLTEDGNVKMEILYNYYYENSSSDENNYSVCVMFHHGSRKFLFTGDLEKEGEEKLAENYDFTQVELFKAGHHGSYTSSNEALLSEIQPKMSVVCCCAGSIERNTRPERLFPSQDFIDRMCKYTSAIYASTAMDYNVPTGATTVGTSDNVGEIITLNGNIVVISDAENGVYVECSNNNTKLKDTDWFKKYRTWPSYGKA